MEKITNRCPFFPLFDPRDSIDRKGSAKERNIDSPGSKGPRAQASYERTNDGTFVKAEAKNRKSRGTGERSMDFVPRSTRRGEIHWTSRRYRGFVESEPRQWHSSAPMTDARNEFMQMQRAREREREREKRLTAGFSWSLERRKGVPPAACARNRITNSPNDLGLGAIIGSLIICARDTKSRHKRPR